MLRSHGLKSDGEIGLPSCGDWAAAIPAVRASAATAAAVMSLRIDMPDLPFGVDAPAGDRIGMMPRESADRWRLGGLPARRHELLAGRLHGAALVPGAALQDRWPAVPAPRHRETGEGLRQPRLHQRRLGPALAAVRRHHDLGDA